MAADTKTTLGLLAALAAGGCAQTADEWLAELDEPALTLDAGVPFDAAVTPLPGLRFGTRTALTTVTEPRGLAVHSGTAYTTDLLDDTLVAFDPESGAEQGRWALPRRGSPALAWFDGALYLGFRDAILRFEDEAFTEIEATVDGLEGLAAEAGALVTAETGALYRRDGERLAPRLELRMSEAPAPLVRVGDDYLTVVGFDRPDGQVFQGELAVLDATSASGAVTRGLVTVDVNATDLVGLDSDDATLFVLGAGYGTDAGHLVTLEIQ